jgi:hypothetical protein
LACRAAYNTFVPYHNFRHVVDVLQATFHFLVCIGALPPYHFPDGSVLKARSKSPLADLVEPFEALTLLITAIGHDVGHPGVNNGFLVTLNAPLAQLYNDRSVLESFHCAAYSQILRRHWPSAFSDTQMRKLMISSILATDMGLHFDYMKKLGALQEALRAGSSAHDWNDAAKTEHKALLCALLIKCADISNVVSASKHSALLSRASILTATTQARRHDTAMQWMYILSDEFSRQDLMERELEIRTSLMAKPTKELLPLATSQLNFMNIFAFPLFEGVADILPAMKYCVDEMLLNKDLFEQCVAAEKAREAAVRQPTQDFAGELSPKTILNVTTSPEPQMERRNSVQEVEKPVPEVAGPDVSDPAATPLNAPFQPHVSGSPRRPLDGRAVNGIVTNFPSSTTDFANHNGPFQVDSNVVHHGHSRQRCSEATDGSSAPNSGDWASQATSATTSRMPLSPSTQGTSIVSRDSFERSNRYSIGPQSACARTDFNAMPGPGESTITVPESTTTATTRTMSTTRSHPDLTKLDAYPPPPLALDDENGEAWRNGGHFAAGAGAGGSPPRKNGCLDPGEPNRQLRKKPSRFRINGLHNLFRKNKNSSPPMQAADTAG